MRRNIAPIVVAIVFIGIIIAVAAAERGNIQQIFVVSPSPTPTSTPTPTNTPVPTPSSTPSPTGSTSPTPATQSEIQVSTPQPNQVISSPLNIAGQAQGSWFFEDQAPVKLVDGNGLTIANGQIRSLVSSQTTNFVPFSGQLTFSTPNTTTGSLILNNDNPSGLPQNSKQLTIPVRFK